VYLTEEAIHVQGGHCCSLLYPLGATSWGKKKLVWGRCRFSRSSIQGIEVAAAMVR
jgi:hypothetical protein